jgi:hypothetical protein
VESLIEKYLIQTKSDDLIVSFLLRFISEIATQGSISILLPKKTFDQLLSNLDSKDKRIKELSITVIGNLCSNSKEVLKLSTETKSFSEYLYYIQSSELELKDSFYHSLALIFESSVNSSESLSSFYDSIDKEIKETSGKSILQHIMGMTSKPFPEDRFASFHLMRVTFEIHFNFSEYLFSQLGSEIVSQLSWIFEVYSR